MSTRRLTLLALLALQTACIPIYDRLDIQVISTRGEHTNRGLQVAEGQIMHIAVTPIAKNRLEDYEEFDVVDLQSLNSSIAVVEGTTRIDEFIIAGIRPGETSVRVRVNDTAQNEIPLRVITQGGQ